MIYDSRFGSDRRAYEWLAWLNRCVRANKEIRREIRRNVFEHGAQQKKPDLDSLSYRHLEFKADWDAFGKMAGPARQNGGETGVPPVAENDEPRLERIQSDIKKWKAGPEC